ncbi:MAG: tetratricopeptide repeat protein [Acidiferrobacterales bacterium]
MPNDLDRALEHHRAGRFAEAETLYHAILASQPAHADALHLLGVLAHQRGAHTEAVARIEQAIVHNPKVADYHNNRGEALRALGRLEEAVAAYQEALALRPDYAPAHSNLGVALQSQGDFASAEAAYRQALTIHPDAETQCNLGDVLREQGEFAEALSAYQQALVLKPDFAEAHNNGGAVLRQLGQLAEAVKAFERAIALKADYAEAYYNLGIALDDQNHRDAATAAFRKALTCKPDFFRAYYQLGLALQAQGELGEAIVVYQQALALNPDAQVCNSLGYALQRQDDLKGAISAYEQAVALKPEFADAHNNLGNALKALGELAGAIAAYRQALRIRPDDATACYNLGNAYWERGDLEDAIVCYRQALALKPDLAAAHNNLGNALVALGRMEEAKEAYRSAIRAKPNHAEAISNLVNIQKYDSVSHEDVSAISTALNAPDLPEQDAIYLHFALGKIYDDCANWDEAFSHYRDANRLKRKRVRFDLCNLIDGVDRSVRLFNRAFFAERRTFGSSSELPVFIVGMPRSGTTLVEQIISSHPRVHGLGESPKVREVAEKLTNATAHLGPYPECIKDVNPDVLSELASEHESYLRRGAHNEVCRVSDKTPLNFFHLGLVSVLFPRARVIHCLRDPLDTCLSIYFRDFPSGYEFAYDLDEIGSFFGEYQRLMAHWHDVLPSRIHDIQYEELVSDREAKTRQLIECLDVEWDARCMSFEENPRAVLTASTWQVRQAIYRSSVERWRNYEKHLGPLKQTLGIDS